MLNEKLFQAAILSSAALIAGGSFARASTFNVALQNPSFDVTTVSDGGASNVGGLDRWLGASAQIANLTNSSFDNATDSSTTAGVLPGPASGRNLGLIAAGAVTNSLYQDVVLLQANTTYTLTAAFGNRLDAGLTSQGGVLKLINGQSATGTVLASTAAAIGAPGTFTNTSLTFTTGGAVAGHLTVAFTPNDSATQVLVDNVVLTATSSRTATAKDLTIMPLGDSITAGSQDPGNGVDQGSGYRDRLYQDLTSTGITYHTAGSAVGANATKLSPLLAAAGTSFSAHEGHSGYTAQNLLDNFAGNAPVSGAPAGNNGGYWFTGGGGTGRAAVNPDIILYMAGTNDIQANQSATTVEATLKSTFDWFVKYRPSARVIVGTIIPFGSARSSYTTLNAVVRAVDDWLRSNVGEGKTYDANFSLVDMYKMFTLADGITPKDTSSADGIFLSDGIHPSHEGYIAIGDAWYNAIAVPEPGSLALAGAAATIGMTRRRRARA